jgi:hypothetical protein
LEIVASAIEVDGRSTCYSNKVNPLVGVLLAVPNRSVISDDGGGVTTPVRGVLVGGGVVNSAVLELFMLVTRDAVTAVTV